MKKIFFFLLIALFSLELSCQKIKTDLVYLLREPAVKTAKTPVLILLHGYGNNEADLFDMASAFDKRFIIFSLRAPNPIDNGGFAWYKMDFLPEQKFKYSYSSAKESSKKVLSFISQACLAYGADSTRVFLTGFSQGAIMSYEIALSAPRKIKGVAALSGRMLDETQLMQTDWESVSKVRFFIGHGTSDNVIKIADAQRANEFLKTKKVTDLTFMTYEMPHTISHAELGDIKNWLAKAAGY